MTPIKTDDDRQAIEWVRTLALLSYPLIFAIAAGLLALSEFSTVFRSMFSIHGSISDLVFGTARVVLSLTVVVLVIQWIGNTWHELGIWSRYLDIAFVSVSSSTAMVGLAVALALLLVLTFDIVLFSGYFSIFLLVNYWTQWVSNDYFSRALGKTRSDPTRNAAVLDVLEEYWLKRPQLARLVTMLFFSSVAFAVAVLGRTKGSRFGVWLQASAYAGQAINILISEMIISSWRAKRDS